MFLNDLGSAATLGEKVVFEGALQHAPDHVLLCWAKDERYMPKGSDDLIMLVRTVFELCHPLLWNDLRTPDNWSRAAQATHIQRAWNKFFHPRGHWHTLHQLAAAEDYDGLEKAFEELLPLIPMPELCAAQCAMGS